MAKKKEIDLKSSEKSANKQANNNSKNNTNEDMQKELIEAVKNNPLSNSNVQKDIQNLPKLTEEQKKEIEKKFGEVKKKAEKFCEAAKEKFKDYILGVSILPPEKKGQEEINVIVAINDKDSKKMTKQELREKLIKILDEIGKKHNIIPRVVLLTDIWQSCFDSNYEILQSIALSTIVYDAGIMGAIKVSEIHKNMVLKKFDKYIVAYVCAGTTFKQGKAPHEKSDIDAFIIIDDTDVKKMTRYELQDKLRAIIYQMVYEASAIAGVKRPLHVQTYLLTDFWDVIKDSSSPVFFTFLRDGIPFYDRGIYMPWKHLLDMGRIKPSREAIRKFNASGDQFYDRAKKNLTLVAVEDAYYAVLNPAQAALMMKGISPPTHKETGRLVREIFVEKEKILEKKYADILDEMIGYYKRYEYGEIKDVSGKEIDTIMNNVDEFRKRITKLYKQIEKLSDKEAVLSLYDQAVGAAREALRAEGIDNVNDSDIIARFREKLVKTGKISERDLRALEQVFKAKEDYDKNDLKPAEIDAAETESRIFVKAIIEYLQKTAFKSKERRTFKVKHPQGFAEIVVLDKGLFIVMENKIEKAKFNEDGSIGEIKPSSAEELEDAVEQSKSVSKLSSKAITALEKHFGSLEFLV